MDIYAVFPKTELKFYLFDEDVDAKMAKKLKKLGLPDITFEYSRDPTAMFPEIEQGLFITGDVETRAITLCEACDGAEASVNFDPSQNAILLTLEGRFFCGSQLDDEDPSLAGSKFGLTPVIRVRNDKGKQIKKPKDEYGMSDPLEALVVKGEYDSKCVGASFKVVFNYG
jgi:hypothetical protein